MTKTSVEKLDKILCYWPEHNTFVEHNMVKAELIELISEIEALAINNTIEKAKKIDWYFGGEDFNQQANEELNKLKKQT